MMWPLQRGLGIRTWVWRCVAEVGGSWRVVDGEEIEQEPVAEQWWLKEDPGVV